MSEQEHEPEPQDAGDHTVPADLVELHETLEWQAAVDEQRRDAR